VNVAPKGDINSLDARDKEIYSVAPGSFNDEAAAVIIRAKYGFKCHSLHNKRLCYHFHNSIRKKQQAREVGRLQKTSSQSIATSKKSAALTNFGGMSHSLEGSGIIYFQNCAKSSIIIRKEQPPEGSLDFTN
jgi:hypothetical protein